MIGRERDAALVATLLRRDDVPIVTLTGPGGVGKTRLALQIAVDLGEDFPDGVAYVALAPLQEPALVPTTIAFALGVPESGVTPTTDHLVTILGNRRFLLVLDNFEQAVRAAPLLGQLVTACRALKILVTSRVVLRISDEHVIAISPLGLPPLDHGQGLAHVVDYPAIRLFTARAQAVRSDFSLDDANAPAVAAICHHLDGLPLAIELAAARIATFSPAELLARMEHRLPLLTGGRRDAPARHRTMRDAIAWSHDLLSDDDQVIFRRLAVFAGGFSAAAAESVTALANDEDVGVMDGIASLVSQSLLGHSADLQAETRFSMLETVREFAMERLAESGEDRAIRGQHAACFLSLAERRATAMPQRAWLERIDLEHDNLRAALAWTIGHGDVETAHRLVAALWVHFWAIRGYFSEGQLWAEQARALGPGPSPRRYAEVLFAASHFASDRERAVALAEEALAVARSSGDRIGEGMALHHLAMAIGFRDGFAAAEPFYEEAMVLLQNADSVDARRTAAAATHNLAVAAGRRGDPARAEILAEAALARWQETAGTGRPAGTLTTLAGIVRDRDDHAQASSLARQAVELSWELGDKPVLVDALRLVATTASANRAHATLAARLWGAADALANEIGVVAEPEDEQVPLASQHLSIVATLGEQAFAAALAAGRAAPLAQIVAEVLELAPTPDPVARDAKRATRHGLSPREVEVLGLIADGRTDREIADFLFLSRRTINAHVAHIRAKLEVPTRRQAVATARAAGLLPSSADPPA